MIHEVIMNSGNKELIIKRLYSVEKHVTFKVSIKSDGFSGTSNFCIPLTTLDTVINTLSRMYNDLSGSCEIKDCDSDAFLIIKMRELGHMDIVGQIGGSHEDHSMRFKLATDQTVLANLIQVLKAMH